MNDLRDLNKGDGHEYMHFFTRLMLVPSLVPASLLV